MKKGVEEGACFMERREDVRLCDSVFGSRCLNELREIDKHDIIVKISELIGPNPSNLSIAEKIFDSIKFDITRFVLHHEYCRENSVRRRLLIWLDSKVYPAEEATLASFMSKYLKSSL
jgi:hypothetical protein